jgi:hypothetical protein
MASMGDAQRVGQGGLSKLTDGPRTTSDLSKVGGGLTRGPNQGKKLAAAAWSETWPAPQSTLDLDFANDRGWVRGVGQGKSMDAVTFTGASNRNYVKPDGTLSSHANQGALGNNLLTFPQDFDNAVWAKIRSTVTANIEIAPDGTLSADKLIADTQSGAHYVRPNGSFTSQTVTLTAYIKAGEYTFAYMIIGDTATKIAYFDLDNGTALSTDGTSSCVKTDDGWCKCILTGIATATTNLMQIGIAESDNDLSFAGDGQSGIFIWGAQLELGSTATEYFPTNIGQPRFDWASTAQLPRNLFLYTEDFSNAYWLKFNITPSSSITAPDNTNLYLFTETAVNNIHAFRPSQTSGVITSEQTHTLAYIVKSNGRRYCNLVYAITLTGSIRVGFDLQDGVISGAVTSSITGVSGSATISDLTSGFYKIVFTVTGLPLGTVFGPVFYLSETGLTNNNNQDTQNTYLGDGVSGIYIGAAQFQTGDIATTYQSIGAQTPTSTSLAANPTSNGLLIEESRANRILWCRDATQANWVSTNVTAAKDQTGIDGVANAASSLTATANDGTCIQTITLASGSRTGSVYLKRITGTGNVQVTLDGSTYSTVELSDTEWRRIVLSGTVTNPTVGIKLAVSGDAVAMDYGQVEDGANETSPILTTNAAVTRAADVAYQEFIVKNWFASNKSGMFFCEFFVAGLNGTTNNVLVVNLGSLVNNSDNNIVAFRNNGVSIAPSNLLTSQKTQNLVSVISRSNAGEFSSESASVNGNLSAALPALSYQTEWQFLGIGNTGRSNNRIVPGSFLIKRLFYVPNVRSGESLTALTRQTK